MQQNRQNHLDTPLGTWLIVSLILFSVAGFFIETLPDLDASTLQFRHGSEIVVVGLFTFVILIMGLGLVAVPTGILASALSALHHEEAADQRARPTRPARWSAEASPTAT